MNYHIQLWDADEQNWVTLGKPMAYEAALATLTRRQDRLLRLYHNTRNADWLAARFRIVPADAPRHGETLDPDLPLVPALRGLLRQGYTITYDHDSGQHVICDIHRTAEYLHPVSRETVPA